MIIQRLVSCTSKYLEPQNDDQRVLEKYLFFPKYIRGELRWLERVRVREIYSKPHYYDDGKWVEVNFIEIPKSNEQADTGKN